MKTINSLINDNFFELLNNDIGGYHVYYNKKLEVFECYVDSDLESVDLIKTPCTYEMKYAFKQEFFSLLNEEEKEIARSYPFRRGYFNYLRENGLYEIYEEAEYMVKVKALENWFTKNNISIPANGSFRTIY